MRMTAALRGPRGVRATRALVCAFFVAFLALGLLTASSYGQPWDELDEMDILRMNLWEYAQVFGLDEAPFEALAARERLSLGKLVPISQSAERDHGISAFYPLTAVVMDGAIPANTRMLVWHMHCWALFTLGAFALYACCRELGLPMGAGLLAALFLLLSPRFFAEGHYNNKDVILLSLTLCIVWQSLALTRKPSFARGVGFAFFGALATNTKIVGLALWGLCALAVLLRLLFLKRLAPKTLLIGGVTLLCFLLFYAALTPALWRDPLGFLAYLAQNAVAFQRWENIVLFRGALFDLSQTALPWYYLPYMIFTTTPLWLCLLVVWGQLSAGAEIIKKGHLQKPSSPAAGLFLCTLLWALPLVFALVTRTTVYNGWRHFYFLYGPMLVLASFGAHALWRALDAHRLPRRALAALLGCCMAFTGVGMVLEHPYQYAYYQPLARLRGANFHELDYWNVSGMNALRLLAEQTEGDIRIGYADLWAQNAVEHGVAALPVGQAARFTLCPPGGPAPRYVLENPTYALLSGFTPSPAMREAVTLTAYGQPIMRVYEDQAIP